MRIHSLGWKVKGNFVPGWPNLWYIRKTYSNGVIKKSQGVLSCTCRHRGGANWIWFELCNPNLCALASWGQKCSPKIWLVLGLILHPGLIFILKQQHFRENCWLQNAWSSFGNYWLQINWKPATTKCLWFSIKIWVLSKQNSKFWCLFLHPPQICSSYIFSFHLFFLSEFQFLVQYIRKEHVVLADASGTLVSWETVVHVSFCRSRSIVGEEVNLF